MSHFSVLAQGSGARLATRLSFLVAGFSMACWAPLVPYAKARLGIDDASLGLLLLCLGIGSLITMPLTGVLLGRFGCRVMILAGGLGLCLCLPLLSVMDNGPGFALTLLFFGASLGAIDVAMNLHAVEVQKAMAQPLMSGFHGLFSLGGLSGAGGMTLLLAVGISPLAATIIAVLLVLLGLVLAVPRCLSAKGGPGTPFLVRPKGFVLLLGALASATFLVEGGILDWAALFLTEVQNLPAAQGGLGYSLFSVTMTLGRLTGDRVVAKFGERRVLLWGGLLAAAGFAVLLIPVPYLSLGGFLLIGLGASNLVPLLFSASGHQTVMPAALAVAAISTMGYGGILAGPALIGVIAHHIGLSGAFLLLGLLMLSVPVAARRVAAV